MRNAGLVVTRHSILDGVWGIDYMGSSNVVDVYIGYLRRKIDKPFDAAMIKSVRGIGYLLEPPELSSTVPVPVAIDLRSPRVIGA